MELLLSDTEIRILGCLLEKEMATPDYYPLSLNSLLNACNQKSNRFPVVNYDDETVASALASLKELGMAYQSEAGRVTKYAEHFINAFNLINQEAALMCVLMLRGPQTVGELRGRTERLHAFEDLTAVEEALQSLMEMDFVTKLPKQPGRKEARFMQLLAGEAAPREETITLPLPSGATGKSPTARITELEENLAALRQEFDALKKELGV